MNLGLRPLIERSILVPLQRKGVRLLTKAALFFVAAFAIFIALAFLTAAFFIWINGLAGPLIAALATAGLYLAIALAAALAAVYGGREKKKAPTPAAAAASARPTQSAAAPPPHDPVQDAALDEALAADRAAAISDAVVPILQIFRTLGWKREEMALLAGAELAKQLPPMTLVGLALICGYLISRLSKLPLGFGQKP